MTEENKATPVVQVLPEGWKIEFSPLFANGADVVVSDDRGSKAALFEGGGCVHETLIRFFQALAATPSPTALPGTEIRALIANLAAIVRIQNGNLYPETNLLLDQADRVLNAAAPIEAAAQEQEELVAAEMKRLHDALCFWLPQNHSGLPDAMQERIAADAYLLVGYDDMPDPKSAEQLGWIVAPAEAKPVAQADEQLSMEPEARMLRAGRRLFDVARRRGWTDDGEGAYEFVTRLFYAQGKEDAAPTKPVAQADEDTK